MSLEFHLRLIKNAHPPPKATGYKLNKYIYTRLTLEHSTSKYNFYGPLTMRNHSRKAGLDQKSKKYIRSK